MPLNRVDPSINSLNCLRSSVHVFHSATFYLYLPFNRTFIQAILDSISLLVYTQRFYFGSLFPGILLVSNNVYCFFLYFHLFGALSCSVSPCYMTLIKYLIYDSSEVFLSLSVSIALCSPQVAAGMYMVLRICIFFAFVRVYFHFGAV